MKTCATCKAEKPLEDFVKKSSRIDGRDSYCKDCYSLRCRKSYQRDLEKSRFSVAERKKRSRKNARDFLVDYLKTHPCIDCGANDIRVLEFDHLDDFEKTKGVGVLIGWGLGIERIKQEIDKCEVRCRNCHAIKTFERLGKTWHDEYLTS